MSLTTQLPQPILIWSDPGIGATANKEFYPPLGADAYSWILEVLTDSGTSPTIDVALQITPDDGTTWWSVSRFAQVTTSDARLIKTHCNGPIRGQAAAVATIADTGGVLETNFPVTRKMRILATITGTNPAFATFKVWCIPTYSYRLSTNK